MDLIAFRSSAAILILWSLLTSALCCDWLYHHNNLRNMTLFLVGDLGNSRHTPTLLRLPDRLYEKIKSREENSQLRFIRDNMEQIYNLCRHGDTSATGWDAVKTTDLLESIDRQIVELNECVKATHNETTSNHYKRFENRLKRYYRYLKNHTLLHPGGRDGWEMLMRSIKENLIRLDLLGNRIKATRGQH